jgi:CII-binding regulator of phage lambda lysogenization HflD
MSGDHAKKEIMTGEKAASSGRTLSRESDNKNKEESSSSIKSHRKGDKKKKMKKVVYYETDSSSPSTSSYESSTTSKHHERKKYSKMPLRYPRISKCAPLLSVPLGKPPYFYGEDYCMWSDKIRHHLTSLHESIWDIVEFGAQAPKVGDKDYDSNEAAQIRHFNSQTTCILLASLCREEYNKVQGLKSAKEIWDVLQTAHEGDEVTKITKRETIEGELDRFDLNKGEEPQIMYKRLKTMVNQVRNLGSTKWDDHEMVKVILRSLVFRNPTQVQLICGDPRYKQMSLEEVIGKFVSFELMIKVSKHIVNLKQGATSTTEVQLVAFKATEEQKESTPSRLPIDASKLDNKEMSLIIKSFYQILKQRRGKDYKSRSKRVCYRYGKSGHSIAKRQISIESDRDEDKKGEKKEKKRYYKKKGGDAHMCQDWDSDESSTNSSSDEDAANITVNKGLLFPNVSHKCLMTQDGKKKKVHSRATPKYTTSSDEGNSSDNEDDLLALFANLNMEQKKKLNELIETINKKDDLLESQDDFLIKENKKFVKLKNAYAQEVEKCENLSEEFSVCHDSISSLRTENDSLVSKIEKLNVYNDSISSLRNENAMLNTRIEELTTCKPSTSTVEHVSICTRCRDVNAEAIDDQLAMIKQQNDHIAKLIAKIVEHKLENKKFKFARSMLYNGRRPVIKDGIGFQQGSNVKLNAPKKLSNFVKGKAPMVQDSEGYILYTANYPEHKIRKIHARKPHNVSHHAFMYKNEASSSRQTTHVKMPRKKIPAPSNEHNVSFKTFDASYVLTNKSGKVVAKYVGGKHKNPKTCVWVPKVLVSNVKGPKTVWVPK